MKVFTLLFLIFALIVTMVACKDIDTDPTPTTAATTTQAPTTVGNITTTDVTTADVTTVTTAATTASLSDTDKFTLEPDRQDLPTYDQLCSAMRVGMYPSEVSLLVGNPQRTAIYEIPMYSYASSKASYEFAVFDSCDGDSIGVVIQEGFVKNGRIYEYGIKSVITIDANGAYREIL